MWGRRGIGKGMEGYEEGRKSRNMKEGRKVGI